MTKQLFALPQIWLGAPTSLEALTCLLPSIGFITEASSSLRMSHSAVDINLKPWIAASNNLTCLALYTADKGPDFTLLAQLKRLQNLTLHDMADHIVSSSQLLVLTACSQLTRLRLDSFFMQPSEHSAAAATAAAASNPAEQWSGIHKGLDAGGSLSSTFKYNRQTPMSRCAAAGSAILRSLLELSVGNMGQAVWAAPVSTLAPNLTKLCEVGLWQHCMHGLLKSLVV